MGDLFSHIKADLYCCLYLFLQTYSAESISGYLTERLFVALAGGLLFHLLLNFTFMVWKATGNSFKLFQCNTENLSFFIFYLQSVTGYCHYEFQVATF